MSKKVCDAGSTGLSMNKALSILGIVALLIILTGTAQAEDLSMYRQDPASTGNTNECFSGDLELLWSYNISKTVWEVSISSDGEYIAAGCFDDTVYFFNREGKLLWQYKTGTIVTSVSISSDGEYIAAGSASHSYISDENGEAKVYLFNRAGKLLWSYEPDGSSVDKVSISSDGNYIVAGVEGSFTLYVFNKKGKLLWSREDIDPDDTSISSDGSYVVTSCCDQEVWGVCLFNKDGKLLWRYEVYDGPYSVSVSADGSYVTAGSDGKVYFFNRAGKLLWSYQHPEQRERYLFSIDVDAELEDDLKKGIFTERLKNIFKTKGIPLDENIISAIKNNWDIGEYSIQKEKGTIDFYRRYSGMYIYYTWISSDGNYVAAKTRGKLYFFNKDGELLWSFQTEGDPGSIWRGVSISLDGSYMVVGNYGDDHHYDGNLYFFNRYGELLGEYKTNTSVESASISSDGRYVAVGTFNMVYCFSTNNVPRVPAAKLVITSPLEITAEDIFYVGDTLTAKFAITNRGVKSVTFDVLVVGGRDPSGEVVDFDETYDVTFNPGDSYDYVGYLTLPDKPGTYHFFCAYQTPDGNWNANIEVEIDGKIVEDFSEAKKYREKNIIVFEKTYISPAPPPVIWEEIHGPWEDKRSGISQIAVHPNNPDVVYAAVKYHHYHWGYEGDEFYKSTNGGSSWNLINLGLPRLTLSEYYWPISAIAIAPSNPDIIYVSTSDINPYSSPVPSAKGIYKSTDGGTEWTSVGGPYTGKWIFKTYCSISSIVVDPIDPNTAYVGTVGGGIWRTTNGGESWDNIWDEPVNKETFLDVNAIAISPANPNTIYAVAYNFNSLAVKGWSGILIPNRLIKSEDGGDTWERLTFGILTAAPKIDDISVDSKNADIVYVITEHYKVYNSTDGGKNWDDASGTDGSNPLPYVSRPWSIGKSGSIAIHPDYSNVIYASGEWGFKSVYVSPNSGENWFPIEDLNDKHVKEIVLASNADARVIYAAAIEGLFKIEDYFKSTPPATPTPTPTKTDVGTPELSCYMCHGGEGHYESQKDCTVCHSEQAEKHPWISTPTPTPTPTIEENVVDAVEEVIEKITATPKPTPKPTPTPTIETHTNTHSSANPRTAATLFRIRPEYKHRRELLLHSGCDRRF
jgi:outer membrane protein assembly factor BamB